MRQLRLPVILLAGTLLASTAVAAPVGWRRDGSGVFPDATPPLHWSSTLNVKWKRALPAWGNASPIVVGERVFVTAEPATLVCLHASDGRILWQQNTEVWDGMAPEEAARIRPLVARADQAEQELTAQLAEVSRLRRELRKTEPAGATREQLNAAVARANELRLTIEGAARYRTRMTNDTVGLASGTPVSDGRLVYVLFGNGVVAAFDLSGHRRWARWFDEPRPENMNGFPGGDAASLVLAGDRLIVPYRKLRVLDPATGKVIWTSGEYLDAGTPVVALADDTPVLATPDGRLVRVSDGQTLAQHLDQTYYNSPTTDGAALYYAGAANLADVLQKGHGSARAFRLMKPAGNVERLWEASLPKDSFFASPVLANGLLFSLAQGGGLTALNAATGVIAWQNQLYTQAVIAYPSLTVAGGYLFASGDDGTTRVLRAGAQFELVAENKLEPFRSSLFFDGRRLYIRGTDHLYCIEEPGGLKRR